MNHQQIIGGSICLFSLFSEVKYLKRLLTLIILTLIIFFGVSYIWSKPTSQTEGERVENLADVNPNNKPAVEKEQAPVENAKEEKKSSDFEFPPIEIPDIPRPVYNELPPPLPPQRIKNTPQTNTKPDIRESINDNSSKRIEDNLGKEKINITPDDFTNKIEVISKVYPKDIVDDLISAGIIKEKVALNATNTIVELIVDTTGRVKKTKIIRGGSSENRNTINTLIEAAASRWVFKPYIDSIGDAQEFLTQVEFTSEDF